jgi:hypothetical protein
MISTLDTLETVKELRAAGFSDEQAEAVTRIVKKTQVIDISDLASNADLAMVKTDLAVVKTDLAVLKTDLGALKTEVTVEFARIRAEMSELRAELIKWVVGIAFAQTATIVALLKLFPSAHP